MQQPLGMQSTRRTVIKMGVTLGAVCALMPISATAWAKKISDTSSKAIRTKSVLQGGERVLNLYHRTTGEFFKLPYWSDGSYNPEVLKQLNHFMRDYRQDKETSMDPRLFDFLHAVLRRLEYDRVVEIVCGYRSPETNQMARRVSKGVARDSQHIHGKAVDFNCPGRKIMDIRNAAISLKVGGVGSYKKSRFVHIDTAEFRTW